ncbi:MAG TPA: hypothetical protein VMW29_01530 [Candidatus Bathyarchaeia archaeon]|nr:hypothetical protein [Candidatus Bathyarchaeia archaeon]
MFYKYNYIYYLVIIEALSFLDVDDLILVKTNFGSAGPAGDINADGRVNVIDLILLDKSFGQSL